jgi:hypothetical protein
MSGLHLFSSLVRPLTLYYSDSISWLSRRNQHDRSLKGNFYTTFRPSNDKSNLAYFQPFLAWFGLLSTLLAVIVLNSASMWNGNCIGVKFASAYVSVCIAAIHSHLGRN